MKYLITLSFVALTLFAFRTPTSEEAVDRVISPETPLQEVLLMLGESAPKHYIKEIDPEKARMGKEMVFEGRAQTSKLGYSNYISNIFVCTDCHNQVQEDPDPANPDVDARLKYAVEKDLPYLQATTFWGMVNRKTWYNEDYVQKYGDLVAPAKNSLYESTQLCAQECSSGRELEEWEAEAINHYYWTLQLRLKDLNLSIEEMMVIDEAVNTNNADQHKEAIELLEGHYMTASPADFVEVPTDRKAGYPNTQKGDPEVGRIIYDRSCKTCHRYGGPSLFTLDESKKTFRMMKRNIDKDTPFALYDIVRHGTYAEPGHRQYMPLYTADRMSDQQLEDLRAYIEFRAAN
ncbi:c-type cytochrome [Sanyastnella coralliicola]|uniref:c-type cytochrome n=1 Tax=Sanyastnella coralliicola TaxID=3069118 RepID=UPI0027BAB365|nr:cytochrome c [Longitalea sp. SCSIO 12813]